MKKKILIVGGIILIIAVVVAFMMLATTRKENRNVITLTGTQLLEKIENKDDFILVVSKDKCSYCTEYKPMLNSVLKEANIVAYEINITNLAKEDQTIQDKVDLLLSGVEGTPTTLFFNEGVEKTVYNRLVGTGGSKTKIKEVLVARGFIK